MTQRTRREDEGKVRENARSFDRLSDNGNEVARDGNERNIKNELASSSGSLLTNRYRDNDLYERQNA